MTEAFDGAGSERDRMEADDVVEPTGFAARYRTPLLGGLAVVLFFAAWQALFLVVPFNPLFISKPSLILAGLFDLIDTGELLDDLRVSAVPFAYGLAAAVVVGVAIGMVMGWRARVGYALDPLMTALYASPLVALAPLIVVFFGVGVAAKSIIIFSLAVFPFIFNAYAGVRAVDPLLINVVRSLGGSERAALFQGHSAEHPALHRRCCPPRHRARAGRRARRGVLCSLRRHRLCHRPLRRPLCPRQDVRLHPDHHGDRGHAHRERAVGGARGLPVASRSLSDERQQGPRRRAAG